MKAGSRRELLGAFTATAAGISFGCGNEKPSWNPVPYLSIRRHPFDGLKRENITVTDVTVTLLSYEYPPEEQIYVGNNIWYKSDAVIVQAFTDHGVVGLGGASRYGGNCEDIKRYIDDVAKYAVIGKNPFDLEFITRGGGSYHKRCAWAGIESALWDIIGKVTGKPIYELLAVDHTPNPRIPVYASGGNKYTWYKNPEALIEEALRHREQGYRAFKFRSGTTWSFSNITLDKYIAHLRRLREAVGPDFQLIQETVAGTGLTVDDVVHGLCPAMEELRFLWFEQPLMERYGGDMETAIEAHVHINEALPTVKVAGAEKMLDLFEMKEWMDRGAYDIVQPDASIQGILMCWQAAQIAALYGKEICPHSWQDGTTCMQNAHFAAGIPNLLLLEIYEASEDLLRTEIFVNPLTVHDGFIELPEKSGFGVELAQDLEKKFPFIPGRFVKPNPAMGR